MGEEFAISLADVSKCYKRYARPVDRLREVLLPSQSRAEEFWALQNLSLHLHKGETLGVIGKNGSGKSTLLQIIAGTLTPTTGEVQVNGRVSALLELGSGFNPEFTGRQNVFFNGQLLGLTKSQIHDRFDSIAAFADIGHFLDEPVKTYSSGMFIRLAFAVAVSVEPDILIVDEALAVGDIFFQQKCFEHIRKLKENGTTILFVSHDTGSVYRLCDRAILLESGNLILAGSAREVIDLYEAKLLQQFDLRPEDLEVRLPPAKKTKDLSSVPGVKSPDIQPATPTTPKELPREPITPIPPHEFDENIAIGSSDVQLRYVKILDEHNQEVQTIESEQTIQIAIGLEFLKDTEDPHVGIKIRDRTGFIVFQTNSYCMGQTLGAVSVGTLLDVRYHCAVPLSEGEYTITLGVADGGYGQWDFKRTLLYAHNVAVLKILSNKNTILWWGVVNLHPEITVHKYSPTQINN